jgi:hypothetical protein
MGTRRSRGCGTDWCACICPALTQSSFAGCSLLALLSLGLLLLGFLATFLSDLFPRLLASSNLGEQALVVLRPTLFTVVLIWFLPLPECQTHAVVMLPCRALIAADHVTLDIFLLFIFPTDASDYLLLFSFSLARTRGRLGRQFRAPLLGALAFSFLAGGIGR